MNYQEVLVLSTHRWNPQYAICWYRTTIISAQSVSADTIITVRCTSPKTIHLGICNNNTHKLLPKHKPSNQNVVVLNK